MSALKNKIQGDLFSRGFPKFDETYYFFSITKSVVNGKQFHQLLPDLATKELISTLQKVLDDWTSIDAEKAAAKKPEEIDFRKSSLPKSNALIAFSMAGLKKIQELLKGDVLELGKIPGSDKAFAGGMANDQSALTDPDPNGWDFPFKTTSTNSSPKTKLSPIDGVFKVAGNTPTIVEEHLKRIKNLLGGTIVDVANQDSRVVGSVRDGLQKGHEHFGFEDGISQPLLEGIDLEKAVEKDKAIKNITPKRSMLTPQDIITVTNPSDKNRPQWMEDGSFLVFRKLEQNVGAFRKLIQEPFNNPPSKGVNATQIGCTNAAQLGAKLMGRWPSGKPIISNPGEKDVETKEDMDKAKEENDFEFNDNSVCPLAAHIRKTNPRDETPFTKKARIVRNGIPYGPDFDKKPTDERGLLFACYQSSIENGYQLIQQSWANNPRFPPSKSTTSNAGLDAFMGQTKGDFNITIFKDTKDTTGTALTLSTKLVTMRGGEYFFVPSIAALKGKLAGAPG